MRAEGIVVLGLLLAAWIEPGFGQIGGRLRDPGGQYSVGRRTLVLVDSSRREVGTAEPEDRRQITINVWYPSPKMTLPAAPYMPNAEKYRGMVSNETAARWADLASPVQVDAVTAPGQFPILLFSHGWGSRSASSSIWLTEVASRGFVVVGVDHPFMGIVATSAPRATPNHDEQFPGPRYSDLYYADDLAFVRSYLTVLNAVDPVLHGIMRSDVVFAAGHSSGHAAASAFAAIHGGVNALISFDAGVSLWARERGLSMPLLLVRAERPTYTGVFVRGPGDTGRGTIYDSSLVRQMTGPMFDLQILGTGHGAILDNVVALDSLSGEAVRATHDIITRYTVAFLESVLAGTPALVLEAGDSARVRLQRVSLIGR
jgi:hypothetical protein